MSSDIAIKVENLSKCFEIYDQPRDRLKQFIIPRLQGMINQLPRQYFKNFWALKDVSFEVKRGETVGIIGRNGSGKSTLLQIICGTLNPTSGTIQTYGRIAALLELGSGFNPEFTGRENVYMNAAVLGLSDVEINNRFSEIVAFAEIGDFIDQPVKTYSSGMVVRLAFAVAINVSPDIMIVDEALSVGDAVFQFKCLEKIEHFKNKGGTLFFVSHDMTTVQRFCEKLIYLDKGHLKKAGETSVVSQVYLQDINAEKTKIENFYFEKTKSHEIYSIDSILARILNVSFQGGGSRITASAGDNIKFLLEFALDEHIYNPYCVLSIHDKNGYGIGGCEISLKSKVTTTDSIQKIFFEMPFCTLSNGIFFLTVSIINKASSSQMILLAKVNGALVIEVKSSESGIIGAVNLGIRIQGN